VDTDTTARSTQRYSLALGLLTGALVGPGILIWLQWTINWGFMGGWGTILFGVLAMIAVGLFVDRMTGPANQLGRGVAMGAPIGILAVIIFFVALGSAIGS
jgi:hypothetical protein